MPLFVCDSCHGIDNSACGGSYWDRLIPELHCDRIICCECYTGKWHGMFPKRTYVGPPKDTPADFAYIPKSLLKKKKNEPRT